MKKYIPKYIQIYSFILSKIHDGTYHIGERIPSEIELSNQFNVSRLTAAKAIKTLENENIVIRTQGVGSFVSQNLKNTDFFHLVRKTSKLASELPETNNHLTISVEEMVANERFMKMFSLKKGNVLYKIIRYNYKKQDDKIKYIAIDTTYLPKKHICTPFKNEDLDDIFIHDFLKNHSKESLKYLHLKMDAKLSSIEEAEILGVDINYPLLICETCVINSYGKIVATTFTTADPKYYKAYVNFDIPL